MKTRRGIQLHQDHELENMAMPAAFQNPVDAPAVTLPLSAITVDPEIQQRAGMDAGTDAALVAEYAETLAGWIAAAPVVVFADAEGIRLLSDGFHRVAAAQQAGLESIPAIVRPGTRQDALRHAIGANHGHGARRTAGDLERAYHTAVREGFCSPDDAAAVAALLRCSERHARNLTAEAREQAKAARNAEIARLADEGKTQREIAAVVGVSVGHVNSAVQKRQSSEIEQTRHENKPEPLAMEPPDASIIAATLLTCLPDHARKTVVANAAPEAAREAINALTESEMSALAAEVPDLPRRAAPPQNTRPAGDPANEPENAIYAFYQAVNSMNEAMNTLVRSGAILAMREEIIAKAARGIRYLGPYGGVRVDAADRVIKIQLAPSISVVAPVYSDEKTRVRAGAVQLRIEIEPVLDVRPILGPGSGLGKSTPEPDSWEHCAKYIQAHLGCAAGSPGFLIPVQKNPVEIDQEARP